MDNMRLEIDGEHAGVKFSACHFIAGHEKCGRLHGHSYVVSIKLHGSIGDHGMIMDFIPLKKALRGIADDLDHRVLIPANSKRITVSVGEEIFVKAGPKRYVFPAEDVVLLDTEESSAEELSRLFLLRLLDQVDFPPNVSRLEVGIDEELGQSAWATHDFR
jgi:6-pyruvoyltetrahydropterin/6-carboxytetrahydropterin synthase